MKLSYASSSDRGNIIHILLILINYHLFMKSRITFAAFFALETNTFD